MIAQALPWNAPARFLFTIILIAPAGFLMGIPFASGLRELENRSPGAIPWAWAINGAISAVMGVVAAMVALDWGFTIALGLGSLAYLGSYFMAAEVIHS